MNAKKLFRSILREHRKLPADMRILGTNELDLPLEVKLLRIPALRTSAISIETDFVSFERLF